MGGGETKSYRMDFSDLTKIAVDRIQNIEPDNFRKIIGFILLNEPSEAEMIALAYGPEITLLSRIDEIKMMLKTLSPQNAALSPEPHSGSFAHGSRSLSSPPEFHIPDDNWELQIPSDHFYLSHNFDLSPPRYSEEDYSLPNHSHFFNVDENIYFQDALLGSGLPPRASRKSPSLPEFPIKACHYFYKGYCKHGSNCRYFHGQSFHEGHSQAFSPSLNELQAEEHAFSPGSLERLELEIVDLLRPRRGVPVSIASLPMLYYEKYRKNLQAEGYLTESQRHGKAGFSLTKLLARLKNSIRLIDRPHGQHSVILVEDIPKYLECKNESGEMGSNGMNSHQIYLTFPSDSTFTEEDVLNYFKQFGPVKDVRIPSQEKRMFGFVSFIYPETATKILMKRVPHYICGARVLVKPYREKSRTCCERIKSAMYYPPNYFDLDSELQLLPREIDGSRVLKSHFDEQEMLLEAERMNLLELSLAQKTLNQQSCFGHGDGYLNLPVSDEFPMEEYFGLTFEAMNSRISNGDNTRNTGDNRSGGLERGHVELPENPFACPPTVGSSISTLI